MDTTADPFEAIADPVRRGLLARVAVAPERVVDLAAPLAISRPAVSRHLRVLVEAGLVEAQESGRERHYRLRPEGLAPLHAWLATLGPGRPLVDAAALDALDTEVRRTARERRRGAAREETA